MSFVVEMFGGMKGAIAALVELAVKAEAPSTLAVNSSSGRAGVLVPKTHEWRDLTGEIDAREKYLYDLEEQRGNGPRRIEGREVAETLVGFCDLVNRHKGRTTAISARGGERPFLVATIDYHGASQDGSGPDPRWKKHVVSYGFPFTPQFRAWTEASKWMSKRAFLDFCDQRALELAPPDDVAAGPVTDAIFQKVLIAKGWTKEQKLDASLEAVFGGAAELLAAARACKVVSEEKLEENIDELGMVAVSYQKKDAVEKWEARRYYLVQVRVFDGDAEERIVPARLDLRVEEGRLALRFVLLGLDLIIESAFQEALATVEKETTLKPIRAVFGGA